MSEPLDVNLLLKAYAIGVFPMADDRDAPDIYWVEPRKRGILPLDGFHVSRSLRKTLRSDRFQTTFNHAFADVLAACAAPTDGRPGTWINRQIETAVLRLHALGHAHSVETWFEGRLVGGLYGVSLGRAFFGESMFSRMTDASKVALAHLVARLRAGGFRLLDCQFQTPHLQSMGAIEISRADYSVALSAALSGAGADGASGAEADLGALDRDAALPPSSPRATIVSGPISGCRILQALTQTS
ncbi:MAG: leucyl/phenylalanyl-tRNA--protein transferase [Chakrabartia godavariana]